MLVKIMAFNIVENKRNACCGEFEEERVKDPYWISFAFLVYKDICKREPLLIHDIKKAATGLNETALDKYCVNVYWLWYDLLDVLDAMVPHEQDWIDNTLRHEERKHLEKPLVQPNQFCKTCWYWLDLITNGGDEFD